MFRFLLLFSFCVIASRVAAQTYDVNNLAFPGSSDNRDTKILRNYINTSANDTSKVTALISLCYKYWRRAGDHDLDSIVVAAKQCVDLSEELHFEPGRQQGKYMLFRAYIEKKKLPAALQLMNSSVGDQKIRFNLSMGEHYMYSSDQARENSGLAFQFFNQAYLLSIKSRKPDWRYQALKALGKCYFNSQNYERGRGSFLNAIQELQKSGDKAGEAEMWAELGRYTPNDNLYYSDREASFKNSISLYHQLNLKHDELYTLEDMAQMTLEERQFQAGEKLALQVIGMMKAQKIVKVSTPYLFVAEANFGMGNYQKALFYVLESLKNMELTGNKSRAGQAYLYLGDIYQQLNDHPNSEKYYRLAHEFGGGFEGYQVITIRNITEQMIFNGKAPEAITYLEREIVKAEPLHADEQSIYYSALGDCYLALHQYDAAEKSYLKMIASDEETRKMQKGDIRYVYTITGSESYYKIANFYLKRHNYSLSRKYIEQSLSYKNYTPVLLRDIRLLQFKLDSASGNVHGALEHFRKYTDLKDSLFNIAKTDQISALQAKYDADQKEKDIALLKQRELIGDQELRQSNQSRTFRMLVICLLILLLAIGYSRYRIKQKANLRLQLDQQNIADQNNQLQQILGKLQNLLKEKEWLLREVHHRVKNNLQLVISLLNSQSAYLSDDVAIKAVTESQNRMQAMSLIHQRLYNSKGVYSIYMPEYIRELIDHLKESFGVGLSICFSLKLDPISLDVSQATPVTLILNELISNVIKHAFPYTHNAEVSVELVEAGDNLIKMSVSDNGVGFPEDYDFNQNKSFGLTLIRGLADEIYGELTIETDDITKMSLLFKKSEGYSAEI